MEPLITAGVSRWLSRRGKAGISSIVSLVLFFGLFFVQQEAAEGDSLSGNNVQIEWESEAPGHVVKITNGKPERISFRIRAGENVSRIKFGISGKDRSIGITISPEEVAAQEGIAGSTAEFNIPRGMPLGRHHLTIRVIDAGTDRVIGTVMLPFILLPSGLECMC